MPLQRRLPKRGFLAVTITKAAEVRSGDLAKVAGDDDRPRRASRRRASCAGSVERAKIILAGAVSRRPSRSPVSAPARARKEAIEKAGGSVAALVPAPRSRRS